MILHENCLLADDSHEISSYFSKIGKYVANLSSAVVVIDALRVNLLYKFHINTQVTPTQ